MSKDFLKIKEDMIRKNAIKKYSPLGERKLNIYFNVSTRNVELKVYDFDNQEIRDEMVLTLDNEFGV